MATTQELADKERIQQIIGELGKSDPAKFLQWENGSWRTYYSGFDLTEFAISLIARFRQAAAPQGREACRETLKRILVDMIQRNSNRLVVVDYETTIDYILALALALTPAVAPAANGEIPERETAWLIERNGTYATQSQMSPDWSTDPWRAHRFTTAREADNARLRLASSTMRDQSCVTQHVFINKQPGLTPAVAPDGAGEVWRCFHCGEVFTDANAAKEHFGPDTEWQAGCVDPLTKDEQERRKDQVDMYTELDREREENSRLTNRDYILGCFESDLAKHFNGAKSVHQAFLVLDAMEGRALAAEEKLAALAQAQEPGEDKR